MAEAESAAAVRIAGQSHQQRESIGAARVVSVHANEAARAQGAASGKKVQRLLRGGRLELRRAETAGRSSAARRLLRAHQDDSRRGCGYGRRRGGHVARTAPGHQHQAQPQARPEILQGHDLRERGAQAQDHSHQRGSRAR